MEFATGHIYHVFNRGNNSQTLFFSREHYMYFLSGMEEYIKPYASILAYCIMPNHFHIMIEVENDRLEWGTASSSGKRIKEPVKYRSLNDSIAIMLRLYTRAVNSEDQKRGPLFHQRTKAIRLTKPEYAPVYFQNHFGELGNRTLKEKEYPKICFDYIHLNPVIAKVVEDPEDWEFSSYSDYFSGRESSLLNMKRARELGLLKSNESNISKSLIDWY